MILRILLEIFIQKTGEEFLLLLFVEIVYSGVTTALTSGLLSASKTTWRLYLE